MIVPKHRVTNYLIVAMGNNATAACYWGGSAINLRNTKLNPIEGTGFAMDGYVTNPFHEDYFWGHRENIDGLVEALDEWIGKFTFDPRVIGFCVAPDPENSVVTFSAVEEVIS